MSTPPLKARANEALLNFIDKLFDVPLRQVELRGSEQSRHKVILVRRSRVEPARIIAARMGGL